MQSLYLIKCQDFYKIGITNDIEDRLAQLSTGNPFDLEIIVAFEFENASFIEKSLHQKFSEQKVKNEWFSLSEKDIQEIKDYCFWLGGNISNFLESRITEEDIDEAEEVQEAIDNDKKWDYSKMFSDGWRMEKGTNGKRYWAWRRGSSQSREYIYGGRIKDLPYSIDEMKKIYGDK